MKMVFLLVWLAAGFLCGCGQKPDSRVVKVEARLTEIESRLGDLETNLSQAIQIVKDMNASRSEFNQSMLLAAEEAKREGDNLQMLFSEYTNLHALLDAQKTAPVKISKFAPPVAVAAPQAATQRLRTERGLPATNLARGIPASVYADILAAATLEWPGNFEMQEYEIKKQVESYKKLHP